MKLFPDSIHHFDITGNTDEINEILKTNVEHSERLVTSFTAKPFIGTVDYTGFRVISSVIRMGAFCVANGKIETNKLQITLSIHPVFKVFIVIAALLPIIGFIILSALTGFDHTISHVYSPILSLLVLRFILVEFGFRYLSKITLDKLTTTLEGFIQPA